MTPVIRVDHEIWDWLKSHARPLEDSPNSVLRRIAGLDQPEDRGSSSEGTDQVGGAKSHPSRRRVGRYVSGRSRVITDYARRLKEEWQVPVQHALYHKDGTYYNHLRRFPGGLFDPHGYVVFKTEREYQTSSHLQHGVQLHVPDGISSMPGYVRKR